MTKPLRVLDPEKLTAEELAALEQDGFRLPSWARTDGTTAAPPAPKSTDHQSVPASHRS